MLRDWAVPAGSLVSAQPSLAHLPKEAFADFIYLFFLLSLGLVVIRTQHPNCCDSCCQWCLHSSSLKLSPSLPPSLPLSLFPFWMSVGGGAYVEAEVGIKGLSQSLFTSYFEAGSLTEPGTCVQLVDGQRTPGSLLSQTS